MKQQQIIAFVGMPGAGKGTCSNYLAETYAYPLIHFGSMVYEEVQRRGLNNVDDEIFVRQDMRTQEGPAVLAKHVARKAQEYIDNGAATVLLDGLYSWTEYRYLLDKIGDNLIVIAVVAPKTLRRQRVLDRKDGHRTYTLEQLIKRELDEVENLEKGGPIAYADHYILNTESKQKMLSDLEAIITLLA